MTQRTPPRRRGLEQLQAQSQPVFTGDCMNWFKQFHAGSVDLVFVDPPFNIGYEYDVHDDSMEPVAYEEWCRTWMRAIYAVLKPTGTFWLAIGDAWAAELKVMARHVGFHTRSWVVWYYTFGVNCTNKLTPSHAHLFYFTKHKTKFTFNMEGLKVPSARQLVYGDKRAKAGGRLPDDTWILRPQWLPGAFCDGEDTWYVPRSAGTFKERIGTPNQMPEQLLGRIIRMCSKPDDLVVDPMCGSGTTLAVAKKLGRRYAGCELSPNYSKWANDRLTAVHVGDSLAGLVPQGSEGSIPEEK